MGDLEAVEPGGGAMARCSQCFDEVPERLGRETEGGEVLCGPCYFALWGPRGSLSLQRSTEARRPSARRPDPGRPIWIPGPSGELDPEEPRRRALRRHREG